MSSYFVVVRLTILVCWFTDGSLASSAKYTVVNQRMLLGWSYELSNINRIQCLLACSEKIYCWSVNYSNQERLCQINKQVEGKTSFGNFQQTLLFEYIEKVLDENIKEHGIHFRSAGTTYDDAYRFCNVNLGSLASYEQLFNAFQPRLDNCTEGWLISEEIAFTELSGDKCTLKSPEQRSNIFPSKYYHSGHYCYKEYNQPFSNLDYIPTNQRIIRVADRNANRLNASESERRCVTRFGGRLATPFEVYNASYSLGVDLCTDGWHFGRLEGNPCVDNIPSEFWLYPTGNRIHLNDPINEYFAMCYISLPNQSLTFPYPYPPHRVMRVTGTTTYSLTYEDARSRCMEYEGGALATRAQLEAAHLAGYDCCAAGWVEGGELVYPVTLPRSGCGSWSGIQSWGFPSHSSTYDGYCYLS